MSINIFYLRCRLFPMLKKSNKLCLLKTGSAFLSNFILLILFSCNSSDSSKGKSIITDDIYFEYSITAEEGDDNLTIKLQYLDGDEKGKAFTLEEPGKTELDGEILLADSSKLSGTYYEIQKPIETFSGKHHIVFTNSNGKQYEETIDFKPFVLLTQINASVKRDSLVFDFEGLETVEFVRVVITDTSFYNEGINRLDTVRNGRLIVSGNELENISNGPVQLAFIREFERPIRNGTEAGGKVSITYIIKRNLILIE